MCTRKSIVQAFKIDFKDITLIILFVDDNILKTI